MDFFSRRGFFLLGALFLIGGLIYGPLILADPILAFDDELLLKPLIGISGISAYFQLFLAGKIIDIQPIRDLSFLLDFFLKKHFIFWSFHLSNVLIWILVIVTDCLIVQEIFRKRHFVMWVGLLLLIHPAAAISVSWIAARKHLLSALFIAVATYLIVSLSRRSRVGRMRSFIAIPIVYGAAIFSHPIGLPWPLWAVIYLFWGENKRIQFKESRIFIILSFVVTSALMFFCIKLNYEFYMGPYVAQYSVEKLGLQFDVPSALAALGRYILNSVFPFFISVAYFPGAIKNILGLVLLPVLVWVSIKRIGIKRTFLWVGFVGIPLGMVIGRQVNVFVSDTYLLISFLGLFVLFVGMVDSFLPLEFHVKTVHKAVGFVIFAVIFCLFAAQSYSVSTSFLSSERLWDRASEVEETPFVLAQKVSTSIEGKQYKKALDLALRFYQWSPEHPAAPAVLAKAVYFFDSWAPAEKIRFLESRPMNDAWYFYYLSALYAATADFNRAYQILSPQISHALRFGEEAEIVAAELAFFCLKAQRIDCGEIEVGMKKVCAVRVRDWDQNLFEGRLRSLMK